MSDDTIWLETGPTTELALAEARIAELEAVVTALSRQGAPIEDRPNRSVWQCTLCGSDVTLLGADDPENHAADCVWAMARKLTKGDA